jgi:hypothetical protein
MTDQEVDEAMDTKSPPLTHKNQGKGLTWKLMKEWTQEALDDPQEPTRGTIGEGLTTILEVYTDEEELETEDPREQFSKPLESEKEELEPKTLIDPQEPVSTFGNGIANSQEKEEPEPDKESD